MNHYSQMQMSIRIRIELYSANKVNRMMDLFRFGVIFKHILNTAVML